MDYRRRSASLDSVFAQVRGPSDIVALALSLVCREGLLSDRELFVVTWSSVARFWAHQALLRRLVRRGLRHAESDLP